jgi:hypothetical protein
MEIKFSQLKNLGDEINDMSFKKNTIILEKMNLKTEYNGLVLNVNQIISKINFLNEQLNNLVKLNNSE